MLRRHECVAFLMTALVCLQGSLGITAAPVVPAVAAAEQSPPNIVLVVVDDLDYASLQANLDLFPSIAGLARDGASFTRFFATTPLCCPSRASILRGQYAHNHGVLQNGGEQGGFKTFFSLGREESTLATWLQGAGYRTGLFGKYLNGYPQTAPPSHVPPGWDEWHAFVDDTSGEEQAYYQDFQLVENGRIVSYGGDPESYSTDVLAAKTVAFIADAAAQRPFFAYVAPYAPHDPATPAARHADSLAEISLPEPPSFAEADVVDKPAYVQDAVPLDPELLQELTELHRDRLRTMLAVDEMVGEIVSTLDEANVLANTYLMFTSDNGFLLGQHRLWHGKQVPYEESIRVPTLIRGPGIAAGLRVDALALNIDLAPTIAELVGAGIPEFVDGRSLAPLLRGAHPEQWRHTVLIENFRVRRGSGRQQEATLRGSPRVPPYRALRTTSHLYVEYDSGERELYDLADDPDQLENLITVAPATMVSALSERLATLEQCAVGACWAAEDLPFDPALAGTPVAASP